MVEFTLPAGRDLFGGLVEAKRVDGDAQLFATATKALATNWLTNMRVTWWQRQHSHFVRLARESVSNVCSPSFAQSTAC